MKSTLLALAAPAALGFASLPTDSCAPSPPPAGHTMFDGVYGVGYVFPLLLAYSLGSGELGCPPDPNYCWSGGPFYLPNGDGTFNEDIMLEYKSYFIVKDGYIVQKYHGPPGSQTCYGETPCGNTYFNPPYSSTARLTDIYEESTLSYAEALAQQPVDNLYTVMEGAMDYSAGEGEWCARWNVGSQIGYFANTNLTDFSWSYKPNLMAGLSDPRMISSLGANVSVWGAEVSRYLDICLEFVAATDTTPAQLCYKTNPMWTSENGHAVPDIFINTHNEFLGTKLCAEYIEPYDP